MVKTCSRCGGTGEKFDMEAEDWVTPIETCEVCKGEGTVSEKCPDLDHIPNIIGNCVVCGYEVMQEVDDNGDPIPDVE